MTNESKFTPEPLQESWRMPFGENKELFGDDYFVDALYRMEGKPFIRFW